MNPQVTILMATRNAADTLPAALASIAQHAPEATLCVWDGESTDDTPAILREHEKVVSHWEQGPDDGVYDALSKLLPQVNQGFIYILGADDTLLPGWADAVRELNDEHTIYYGNVYMRSKHHEDDGPFDAAKLSRRNICQQAVFYPRAVFDVYPLEVRHRIQADWTLHMRLWSDPAWHFQYFPHTVCSFNDEDGLSSTRYDNAFNADYPRLVWESFPPGLALRRAPIAWLAHHTRRWRGKTP